MQAFDGEHPAPHILNLQATSSSWPIHLPLPSRMREADDETLIRLVTQGSHAESQSALEAIYIRHHRDVWRYVRSRLSSATDADEVAAGVWVVVIEKIYDFVWTGTPIKSWLLSIAHRKVLEFFNDPPSLSLEGLQEKQNQVLHFVAVQLHLVDQSEPFSVDPEVRKEADELVHRVLTYLSEIERRIIMLLYFEEMESATEVAKRLGMNKNTIRVYHKRARDKLRKSPELSRLFEEVDDHS